MLDLEAAIWPHVNALAVTKVDSADHVQLIDEVVSELEAERGMAVGTTQFLLLVETPAAWFRMPEIARASRRIVALTLGGEDFALAMGMLPNAEALLMPKQQLASRRARPASCRSASSARSPTTRTSTPSARPCGARAASASSARP